MRALSPLRSRFRSALYPVGQGAWLFKRRRIAWMYEPALRRQLPPLFRLFAAYCALAGRLRGGEKVFLGDRAFALVSRLGAADNLELDLGDFTVCLDLSDPRCLEVVNELRPGHPLGSLLGSLPGPGDTFVDVGANHGSFSLLAGRAVGESGRVVAVEPNPRLAALVSRSLSLSVPCPYQVLEMACGDRETEVDFFIPRGSSGAAGIFRAFSGADRHRCVRVRQRRFDDAVDWRGLPGRIVLKVDVEGSEHAFLRGATEMIRNRMPTFLLEFNPTSLRAAGVEASELVGLLCRLGYESFSTVDEPTTNRRWNDLDPGREVNLLLRPGIG